MTPDEEGDYDKIIKRLETRYGHAHMETVYYTQLKGCLQRADESLQDFESNVARLVRLAYPSAPDDFLECLAVRTFVDGLRNSDTQEKLVLSHPKTLAEALAHTLEFEAAKQYSKCRVRVRAMKEDNQKVVEDRLEGFFKKMQEALAQIGQPKCWNCGEAGHRRNCCKKLPKKPSEQSS